MSKEEAKGAAATDTAAKADPKVKEESKPYLIQSY